jgi:hypothetical protein
VRHRANPKFWRAYELPPAEVQMLADLNSALLKQQDGHSAWPVTRKARQRAFVTHGRLQNLNGWA